jgi:glycine hydroxymethyltransferase
MVTSTTHKTLRGPRGALILCREEFASRIDEAVFPGIQAGPLMHIVAAKAVAFKEAQSFGFREYQRQIIRNCQALAQSLLEEGFTLVTGGTDNHLLLVNLTGKGITGRDAADLLERAGIVVNKNTVPNDPLPPAESSGIRPGTPALTTRGMREQELHRIGKMIARVLRDRGEHEEAVESVRQEVLELCDAFPIYQDMI